MTKDIRNEIEKTKEVTKAKFLKLNQADAKLLFDDWKTSHRNFTHNKAIFYRLCWRVHTVKLYKYFDVASEDELIDSLGMDNIGKTTFREACRVYKQFLDRVKKLSDFTADDESAKDYTDDLLNKAYAAVGANGSYLGELARTNIVRGTKRESEENIEGIKKVAFDAKDYKEFAKIVKNKFGIQNPTISEAASNRVHRKPKSGGVDGDKFMVNLRFDAAAQARVVALFEKVSASVGLRTKYADMSSDEIGNLVLVLANRAAKGEEVPNDLTERKRYTTDRAREMALALTGAKFPEDIMTDCLEDIKAILEPIASKLKAA